MEDYKQKYEEALKRARIWKEKSGMPKDRQGILDDIFPELKKSEDELIREKLINFLEVCEDTRLVANRKREKWISWLMNTKPKFKVGDWVIFNIVGTYQVEKIENYEYTLRHTLGGSTPLPFSSENLIRLWSIQDAKDGDVLVCEGKISKNKDGQEIGIVKKYVGRVGGCDNCFETYCFIDWNGNFRVSEAMGSPNIHPATKDQRDILFSKMKEASYKWDDEKKELKKIELKSVWSKENNCYYDDVCEILINLINSPKSNVNKDAVQKDLNWLMSVKESQSKLTWNEEDEDSVDSVIRIIQNRSDDCAGILDSDKALKWFQSLKRKLNGYE